MLLNEKEVNICIQYILIPFLKKNDIDIQNIRVQLNDGIEIQGKMIYQSHNVDFSLKCHLDYQDGTFCFLDVDGKVDYLFLQLNILTVLQQFVKDPMLTIQDHSCFYKYELPIRKITIEQQQLIVDFI